MKSRALIVTAQLLAMPRSYRTSRCGGCGRRLYELQGHVNRACRDDMRLAGQRFAALFYLALVMLACLPAGTLRAQAQAPAGEWVWANGNSVSGETNVTGVYGVLGVASPTNTPPGLQYPSTWSDGRGNLWLFGGQTFVPSEGGYQQLNDLWKFDPYSSEWTWVSGAGSNVIAPGIYDQLGAPSAANDPGGRIGSSGWLDKSGDLWLFGGRGYDSMSRLALLNDLWKFDPVLSEWSWMGGLPSVLDSSGCGPASFGTLGVSSASNSPGGRQYPGVWVDGAGTFWLFGGMGCDATGTIDFLDDLWSYVPSTGQWTWVGGSNTVRASGVYGTQGVASVSNQPGSRYALANWTDAGGDLWLFGGQGLDSAGAYGYLNDLWRFNPSTRQWTWVSGSDTIGGENCDQNGFACARTGVYGTLGQAAADNVPGGRSSPVGAAVANGNFLVFGGFDDKSPIVTYFNDLWQFNPISGEWTWIDGSNKISCGAVVSGVCVNGEPGVYGTKGTPDATNFPGGRADHVRWTDKAGNFWMFGGTGFDSQSPVQELNDIWEYKLAPLAPPPVAATVTVTSSANPIFTKTALTLTAHVTSTNVPPNPPTGKVDFSEDDPTTGMPNLLGSAMLDASGEATLSLASLPVGTHSITAAYSGDGNNLAGTSGSLTEVVGDFSLVADAPTTATVASGGTATFNLTLTPVGPITTFPSVIGLTASGGPANATYTFAPASIASGSAATHATLTIAIPAKAAVAAARVRWPSALVVTFALVGLLLPFAHRGNRRRMARPARFFMLIGALACALAMGGCGNKFYVGASPQPPQPPDPPSPPATQTYTITVVGSSGALHHFAMVTIVAN